MDIFVDVATLALVILGSYGLGRAWGYRQLARVHQAHAEHLREHAACLLEGASVLRECEAERRAATAEVNAAVRMLADLVRGDADPYAAHLYIEAFNRRWPGGRPAPWLLEEHATRPEAASVADTTRSTA